MFCSKCGAQNPEGVPVCSNCRATIGVQSFGTTAYPSQQVPNYLVQAILVTACCCLPIGIVSIVYAAQVNSKLAVGDINGAMQSSEQAKKWVLIAFVLGLISGTIVLGLQFMGMMATGASQGFPR